MIVGRAAVSPAFLAGSPGDWRSIPRPERDFSGCNRASEAINEVTPPIGTKVHRVTGLYASRSVHGRGFRVTNRA